MEHKIINTESYLLIVDDSEIKEGDWYIDLNLKQIFSKSNPQISKIDWQKKIIAHLPNNSPILEGVPLLPSLKDEVDKFESFLDREIELELNTKETIDRIKWYYQQYFKSKQKNYTEDDLMKVIDMAREYNPDVVGFTKNEIIQSLQQSKMPVGFKFEMEKERGVEVEVTDKMGETRKVTIPYNGSVYVFNDFKTTTNSQGHTQLVGEYIF